MVRWMCDIKDLKVQDRCPSKELTERLGIDDNLSTTAKHVAMVCQCVAKRRQRLGEEMYGV